MNVCPVQGPPLEVAAAPGPGPALQDQGQGPPWPGV